MSKKKSISLSKEDRLFYAVIDIVLFLIILVVAYPLVFILSSSFSSTQAVISGKVWLLPVDFSIEGYRAVFSNGKILIGYRNSLMYTVLGTSLNIVMTMLAAYPLTRKDMPGRDGVMMLFSFTMLFSGGMIPNYLLMNSLGMINTVWALIIPGAISVHNMIITRTFIQSNIPNELLEASQIDGCSDFKFFTKMVIPLSKSVIAVITLYYAIGHWNAYFNALLYIRDPNLNPLQIFLREILVNNTIDADLLLDPETETAKQGLADLLKYSLIVVATVPVLIIYPFVQKHFVKGVMIGSVKG